jgi:hypothetical protein
MLTEQQKSDLKVLGLDVAKLEEAVKSESAISLDVPKLEMKEGKVKLGSTEIEMKDWLSPDQKEAFQKNVRNEGFEEGKKAIGEIAAKVIKKDHGLDFEGKDIDTAVKMIVDKKLEGLGGDQKEWEQEKATLQENLKKEKERADNLERENSEKSHIFEVRGKLGKLTGEIKGKKLIDDDLVQDLFLQTYTPAQKDGRTVWKNKQGEIIKDQSTLNPLGIDEIFPSWVDSQRWLDKSGIEGSDNSPAGGSNNGKFKNTKEFREYCKKNDLNPVSPEAQTILRERREEGVPDEQFYVQDS